MNAPATVYQVLSLAANEGGLYALRDDGAVFVLLKRGAILPNGETNKEPHWVHAPAVPGTLAAFEQEGSRPK